MRSFAFVLLASLTAAASAQTVIDSFVYPPNGHTFDLLSSSNWTDAEAKAVSLGGHLATITDDNENSVLGIRFGVFSDPSTFQLVYRDLWIGFNDMAQPGTFVWSSGQSPSYTVWDGGQPSSGDFAYIHYTGYSANWRTSPDVANSSDRLLYGVVEIAPVPEPTSLAALGLGALALVRRRRKG